jgi:hypothetical protein
VLLSQHQALALAVGAEAHQEHQIRASEEGEAGPRNSEWGVEVGRRSKAWAEVPRENLSVGRGLLALSQRLLLIEDEVDPWCRRGSMLDGGHFLHQDLHRRRSRHLCLSPRQTIRLLQGGRGLCGLWVEFESVLGLGQSPEVGDRMGWLRRPIAQMVMQRHLQLVPFSSRMDFSFRCQMAG